jgi:hypothetical protein
MLEDEHRGRSHALFVGPYQTRVRLWSKSSCAYKKRTCSQDKNSQCGYIHRTRLVTNQSNKVSGVPDQSNKVRGDTLPIDKVRKFSSTYLKERIITTDNLETGWMFSNSHRSCFAEILK